MKITLSSGKEMSPCELRVGAAAVIEERGWCQGTYVDADGSVCLIGAFTVVMFGTRNMYALASAPPTSPEYQLFFAAIRDMGLVSPPMWNDHSSRTVDHVLEKLRDGCVAETAELESATP